MGVHSVISVKSRGALWIVIGMVLFVATAGTVAEEGGQNAFRSLDPAQTLYLDLPDGRVVIELNPDFAPRTVAQFKSWIREGFFDGLDFYRVIEGFVVQGGDGSDLTEELEHATLKAEFERAWSKDLAWTEVQNGDLFADETGFVDGFAAARDVDGGRIWLTHCPGVVALARNNDKDSSSTDFYIVIGQAPRYLDRNLTIFGRVVHGMQWVQRIERGPRENDGVIEKKEERTRIVSMRIAADLPEKERMAIEIIDTSSSAFANSLESRRHRQHEFFHHTPPAVLDVCQVPVVVKIGS